MATGVVCCPSASSKKDAVRQGMLRGSSVVVVPLMMPVGDSCVHDSSRRQRTMAIPSFEPRALLEVWPTYL